MSGRVRGGGRRRRHDLPLDKIKRWSWFVFYAVCVIAIVAWIIWGR